MSHESSSPLKIKIKPPSKKKLKRKYSDIYTNALISKTISIPITSIGINIDKTIENTIANEIEGKCIEEGFIRPDSTRLVTYSSGQIRECGIQFEIVIECLICSPVEGTTINCVAKNITKAGIRAEIDDDYNPLVIFVARDHNYMSDYFGKIKEGDKIAVKVIGQRFELFDKFVSVIGQLVEKSSKSKALVAS